MEELEDIELVRFLSSFSCTQDEDIESFLYNRAVEFERLAKSRTYLICDQDQFVDADTDIRSLIIYGYISVALKVLSVPDEMSNRARKEIDGFSAKIRGEQIKDFPCYLIGQLARASNVPKESVAGKEIIDLACDIIADAVQTVGGRYLMIECHDNAKLVQFYERNYFKEIAKIKDGNRAMVQMIRKIG